MFDIPTIHIPANSLTPDEWAAFIEAYATSPAVQASIVHGLETLSRTGVTFTPEQTAQIRAWSVEDAQRIILDQLNAEFSE